MELKEQHLKLVHFFYFCVKITQLLVDSAEIQYIHAV